MAITSATTKTTTQVATKGEVKSTIDEYNKVVEANYPNKWQFSNLIMKCSTAAATAVKTISSNVLRLLPGTVFFVYFDNTNTASNPKLSVSESGTATQYTLRVKGSVTTDIKSGLYVAIVSSDKAYIDLYTIGDYINTDEASDNTDYYVTFTPTSQKSNNKVSYNTGYKFNPNTGLLTTPKVSTTELTTGTFTATGNTTLANVNITGATMATLTATDYITVSGTTNVNTLPKLSSTSISTSTLTTTGDTTVGGTLTVGTASAKKATTLNGTLSATGNTTIGGTLGVTGATTLSSTLGVAGAVTLSDSLSVGTTSTFTGAATFSDAVSMTSIKPSSGTTIVTVSNTGALSTKSFTDSSSASAIGTGTSLVTERDIYYGLPTINNNHTYTSSTTIYAPTTGGTTNYVLTSAGSTSTPTWTSLAFTSSGGAAGKTITSLVQGANGKITTCTFSNISITSSQVSDLWATIKANIGDTEANGGLGLSATQYSGNAATASKLGTANLGGATQPIYLKAGVATVCSTYGGGTAVTLNGTSKAASTASFYSPTAGGTSGQILVSQGTSAPTWSSSMSGISITNGTTKPAVLVIPSTAPSTTTVGAIWFS